MYVCLKETTCVWVWLVEKGYDLEGGKRHELWKKAGHVNERIFELDFFCQKCFGMTLGHNLNRGWPFPKRSENAKMVLAWKWPIVVLPFGCCSICFLRQIHRVRLLSVKKVQRPLQLVDPKPSQCLAMSRRFDSNWRIDRTRRDFC